MNDHEALLRNIIDNPSDDVPRLIYADWLEENGNAEQAEFIRVQCELAKRGKVYHLTEREQVLLNSWAIPKQKRNWSLWAGSFLTQVADGRHESQGVIFRRGFVDEIVITCDQYLKNKRMLRRYPLLGYVTITDYRTIYARSSTKRRYITPFRDPVSDLLFQLRRDDRIRLQNRKRGLWDIFGRRFVSVIRH